MPYVTDSSGSKSASLTLAIIAFTVTTLWIIASMFETIGGITIRPIDMGVCAAYMMPVLSLYWARRNTQASATSQAITETKPGE